MASLVADYGESSQDSSRSDDSDGEPESQQESALIEETVRLPPPAFSDKIKNSVFVNPFLEAEIAQYAVLEKHVKMVPQRDQKATKKMCYMFKKGKCRFGKKCKFAHNTDNGQVAIAQETNPNQQQQQNNPNQNQRISDENKELPTGDSDDDGEPLKKKKRPGLTRGLIPSKRVMNLYKQQKEKCGK